ncbi:uncharacterized protein FA14DRAFT_173901 [Meira miltonrushii]|uniref:Transcription initiation factor TFIID subunit 13 n=1 Tax=Meira miltonrushii TaxID=1280837 RepID=A0A316V9B5_9BASI|nr:uncharacterized protein FA14DRAFT_173901 [Meira miltonrushii]PWN34199.1 hypothetical protein FA14DRAFT_173901 [Meira miltonrushii]
MPPQPSASGSGQPKRPRGEGNRRGRGGGSGAGGPGRATAAAAGSGGAGGGRRGMGAAGAAGGIGQGRRGPFVYKNEFRKDIEGLMYAFGDAEHSDPDSIALMEDMTVSFLVDLIKRARPSPVQLSVPSNPARVQMIAQADAQQRQWQNEQRLVDHEAERAAAGTSATAIAKAQKRVAAANAEHERRRAHEMMTRTNVHPFVGRTRMTVEDIKFACRKDAKLTSRIEELIYLDKEIQAARKVFDVPADEAIQQENANSAAVQADINAAQQSGSK